MDLHIDIFKGQLAGGLALVLPANDASLAGGQGQLASTGDGELTGGVDGVLAADGAGAVLHHIHGIGGEVDAGGQ